MKTTLVIMAAGIGSRFGSGIKQLEPVGPNGEIIMDYSIHDAIEAGFQKIVFIIRRDIEEDFREIIGSRIEKICRQHEVETGYAFQELSDIPDGFVLPKGRKKPWGTGQAVLAAKNEISGPFAVINADDYYGKEAFTQIHGFLEKMKPETSTEYCMAGFILKNTLSDHGGVTRGVCAVNKVGYLTGIRETPDIVKTKEGASADGRSIDPDSYVSMNMWGLPPEFLDLLEKGYVEFFRYLEDTPEADPEKTEYLIPTFIGELLDRKEVSVKVLPTHDKWFGVTYKEDKQAVVESFAELIRNGVYREDLFSDLK
jgi:UTP-glucose-1-phosphate uridylyltransferase